MLGKYRLKPSFLLEVAFLVGVWLIAWRVFDPPLAMLVFVIFTAYALVFLYENWLDSLSRRERANARRSQRNESELYRSFSDPSQSPRPSSSVQKLGEVETVAATHSISERLTARLHGNETEEEATPAAPAIEAPVAPTAPALSAAGDWFERPAAPIKAKARTPEPEPQPEPKSKPPKREQPAPLAPAENAPRSVSEAARAPRSAPAPGEKQPTEPEQPHSLMAEIAAGPDARKPAESIGGWNVWQLERLLAAHPKPDPERDYERSMLLVYLREFADSDGQLPSQFDDLVRESFSDLVHGPGW